MKLAKKSKTNVVLLVLDSMRFDHLSVYNYNRRTSPNLDWIGKKGAVFENAFSAAPWTIPSHASIFTGKYPSSHKCVWGSMRLGNANATLTEILKMNGYRTIGVSACPLLEPDYGVGKGFDFFLNTGVLDYSTAELIRHSLKPGRMRDVFRRLASGPDQQTSFNNVLIKNLLKKESGKKRPFFLFANYFNCHAPYDPPRPFKEVFSKPHLTRSDVYIKELILNKIAGRTSERVSNVFVDIHKLRHISSGAGGFDFIRGELEITKEEWEIIRSWYDGEIAYLDFHIGQLVKFLEEEDLFDNTILVITSDHGEIFGEHGLASHAYCLYDVVLHVPLIVTCPSLISEKDRVDDLVSTIDVFPSITHMLHIKDIKPSFQGRSLFPLENQVSRNFICAEFERGHKRQARLRRGNERGLKCIRSKSWKYIFSSDKEEELYNLESDPLEETNLKDKYRSRANSLRKKMSKIIDVLDFGPEADFARDDDRQLLKRLEALGYA